jgi:hypothetical protein
VLKSLNRHEFYIGDAAVAGNAVGYLRAFRPFTPGNRQFAVTNNGSLAFTLSVLSSKNNNVQNYPTTGVAADAYSAINMRVDGASVASLVVQPGGFKLFTIEVATEEFLRFDVTPLKGVQGVLRVESLLPQDVCYPSDPGSPV